MRSNIINELLDQIDSETYKKVEYELYTLMYVDEYLTCQISGAFESEIDFGIQPSYGSFYRNELEEIYQLTHQQN